MFSLDSDNALRIEPAPEVESLRFDHRSLDTLDIPANATVELGAVRGKSIEIDATIDPAGAREVGLCVLRSPDGLEQTRISFFQKPGDPDPRIRPGASLQMDVSASSTRGDVLARTPETGPLVLADGEPLRLQVFVDRSIVEVFANGRQCLTVRAYPDREDSAGVSVFARGGAAKLRSLDAWQMRSVWPELAGREGT